MRTEYKEMGSNIFQALENDIKVGFNVTGLFRNYLNLLGIDWDKCEQTAKEFDAEIQNASWLESDNGCMFDKTFDPNTITIQ